MGLQQMLDEDDRELENAVRFMGCASSAAEAAKLKGDNVFDFRCPLCGEPISGSIAPNGHISAECAGCEIGLRQ